MIYTDTIEVTQHKTTFHGMKNDYISGFRQWLDYYYISRIAINLFKRGISKNNEYNNYISYRDLTLNLNSIK